MNNFGELSPQQLKNQRLQLSAQLGQLLRNNDALEAQSRYRTEDYRTTRLAIGECFQGINDVTVLLRLRGIRTDDVEQTLYCLPGESQLLQPEDLL
jgi:hypothetical protein